MANILTKPVEKYLDDLLPRRDAVLMEMEARARRERIPIIGPACGRLLALLVQMSGARRIFEMGSAIGYSTIWLARAAGPRAEVHYTDGDPNRVSEARAYLKRAGVARRVEMHHGDALAVLKATKGSFDCIFCDVDKADYPESLRLALPRLRRGGLFIADNVLWSGKVARRSKDSWTRAIDRMNRAMYRAPNLFSVIVPLRDGVAVARKA